MTQNDSTPKTTLEPNDTVRLIREPTSFTATPQTIVGDVSSTGKTLSAPDRGSDDSHIRLDADEMAELLRGGAVYRDSYHYRLHTPEVFADRCEAQKRADPMKYRGSTPTPAEVRDNIGTATHAPQSGVFAPGGKKAPDHWTDGGQTAVPDGGETPDGGDETDADADETETDATGDGDDATGASDPLRPDDSRHDMTEWLAVHDGVEAPSGDGSAYIARVEGEHSKYGVDREFVTSKDNDMRYLQKTNVRVGDVYEIQHGDAAPERTYQVITAVETDDNGPVDIETTMLKDSDEALDALAWDEDPEIERMRDDLVDAIFQMDDDDLRVAATRLGVDPETRDPADLARVNPNEIPGAAGEHIQRMRKAFVASYERRFDAAPDAETRAAMIDAAAVAEKRRNN